jgi:hypothetical protein
MQNYFAIEVELAHHRFERERDARADAQHAAIRRDSRSGPFFSIQARLSSLLLSRPCRPTWSNSPQFGAMSAEADSPVTA